MKVVVSAVSFSKNEFLVNELKKHFPNLVINSTGKRFSKKELVDYYDGADAIITGLEIINDELLSKLPDLKIISKFGVGLDNIDLNACDKRGISIGWTGGVNKRSVSEMALGFMLMLSRNLYITSNQLKNDNNWNKSGGSLLSGKTVGIIGVGHIGRDLIKLLRPFECEILINDIVDVNAFAKNNDCVISSKKKIYKNSDIISISDETSEDNRTLTKAAS